MLQMVISCQHAKRIVCCRGRPVSEPGHFAMLARGRPVRTAQAPSARHITNQWFTFILTAQCLMLCIEVYAVRLPYEGTWQMAGGPGRARPPLPSLAVAGNNPVVLNPPNSTNYPMKRGGDVKGAEG